MLILFGEQKIVRIAGEGKFPCPVCEGTRRYEHIRGRNVFSIFFIPLLPLEEVSNYVECQNCGNSFHPGIIDEKSGTNDGEEPEYWRGARRIMVQIIRNYGAGGQAVNKVQEIYKEITSAELSEQEVRDEMLAVQNDERHVLDHIKKLSRGLNDPGKQRIIMAAFLMLSMYGELRHEEKVMMNQLGASLDVPSEFRQKSFKNGSIPFFPSNICTCPLFFPSPFCTRSRKYFINTLVLIKMS